MLLAPRYTGLEIHTYPKDTAVAIRPEFEYRARKATEADSEHPAFIRAARIRTRHVHFMSLAKLLERTDEELDRVAELCGAFTVEHEWGLYPVVPGEYGGRYDEYLPPGSLCVRMPRRHILVARVAAIPNARRISASEDPQLYARVAEGTAIYNQDPHKMMLGDISVTQFIVGKSGTDNKDMPGVCQPDIEPRIVSR